VHQERKHQGQEPCRPAAAVNGALPPGQVLPPGRVPCRRQSLLPRPEPPGVGDVVAVQRVAGQEPPPEDEELLRQPPAADPVAPLTDRDNDRQRDGNTSVHPARPPVTSVTAGTGG